MSGEGGRHRGVIAVALAALGIVLVAVVSSGARVPLATEGSGGWHFKVDGSQQPVQLEVPTTLPSASRHAADPPGAGVIPVLVQAFLILALVALLVAGVGATVRTWRRGKAVPRPVLPPEPVVAPSPNPIVDVLDESLDALATGPVDEVIIGCWVKLERAAASAGVERRVSETPAELASRVLADLAAPPAAVDALLDRYRTARYSQHLLDEEDRAVAIRALEEIRAAIVGAPA